MRKRTLVTAIAVASASLMGGLAPAAVASPDKPGSGTTRPAKADSDFNGDGYGDLVANIPTTKTDGAQNAGTVVVLYGSAQGVAKRQLITQNTPGIPGASEAYDNFGGQAVAGDFDGDGYADLAIGADGEDLTVNGDYRRNAGQITLVWGGKHGLARHGATTVRQTEPTDLDWRRGSALAAGDFNHDGKADLATGDQSPGRGGEVLYGPISRTGKPKSTVNLGIKDAKAQVDIGLETADVTGDRVSDLVIQVSRIRFPATDRFEIHKGTKKGLLRTGSLTDAQGKPLTGDEGNDPVAVGDLDRDGHADIAVGLLGRDGGSPPRYAGSVTLVYGGPKGQSDRSVQVITQDTPGVPDESEEDDFFGNSVAIGDTNGDGYGDLAVGASRETFGQVGAAGQVTVLPGGPQGVTGAGSRVYHQDTEGVPGTVSESAAFGSAVKLTDLNGDKRADLAVGGIGYRATPSRVTVLPADRTSGAITGTGSKSVTYTDLGLPHDGWTGFGGYFGR
ncbi:hypothetical protein ACFVIM_33820 [Streptomyces sp. NPDC057638]|uniref:hypothetical protein n=1 Tax=Streptomyces sp. NPDC057638 TaxID=3346190 RepID=UPI003698A77E